MDKTIINYLEELGLSEVEAKLYLTILETTPKSVQELARIMEINRTTVYLHIERLIKKELIIKIIKGGNKLITANKPDDILKTLLNKKVESVSTMQKKLSNITDELTLKYSLHKDIEEAEVKYYKGKLGVRKIYEEALKANILCSYVNQAIMHDALPDNMQLFEEAVKNNKDIKIFEIVEDSTNSRREIELQSKDLKYKKFFYRFLPKDVKLSSADTLIYNNKVAIINVGNKQITGVVLHNIDYYKNTKAIFDSYWNMLQKID
jgi:sugar-specific transcriptional regulator TrmB